MQLAGEGITADTAVDTVTPGVPGEVVSMDVNEFPVDAVADPLTRREDTIAIEAKIETDFMRGIFNLVSPPKDDLTENPGHF